MTIYIHFLIGRDRFGCVSFEATFFVNTQTDNDYAGFVFSFQSNRKFYLISWKKAYEEYWTGGVYGNAGLSLKVSCCCCCCCNKALRYLLACGFNIGSGSGTEERPLVLTTHTRSDSSPLDGPQSNPLAYSRTLSCPHNPSP